MASTIQREWAPDRSESVPRSGVLLTEVLLVCMALIWGVNYSVVKLATHYFEPLVFNALRISLAVTVLGAITFALREHAPPRAVVRRLILLGLLGNGVYQISWIEGLARVNAGTAALIFAATPAFIGIVGRALRVEYPTRRAWFGIALQLVGMAGVVLGTASQAAGAAGHDSLVGLALILGAAVCWAFYTTLLKRTAQNVHPVPLSAWTLVGGLLVYAVVATPGLLRLRGTTLPNVAWAAVVGSGLGALVVAYLFYYRGMKVIGPVKTAMFSNLQPVVALVVAYFVLHEIPTTLQLGGAALIMTGLVASRV